MIRVKSAYDIWIVDVVRCPEYFASNQLIVKCWFTACGIGNITISHCNSKHHLASSSGNTILKLLDRSGNILASDGDGFGISSGCTEIVWPIAFSKCETFSVLQRCYGLSACTGTTVIIGHMVSSPNISLLDGAIHGSITMEIFNGTQYVSQSSHTEAIPVLEEDSDVLGQGWQREAPDPSMQGDGFLSGQYITREVVRVLGNGTEVPIQSCGYLSLADFFVVNSTHWDIMYNINPSETSSTASETTDYKAPIILFAGHICDLFSADLSRLQYKRVILLIIGSENGNILSTTGVPMLLQMGDAIRDRCPNITASAMVDWIDHEKIVAVFTVQGVWMHNHPKVYMLPIGTMSPSCYPATNTLERYGVIPLIEHNLKMLNVTRDKWLAVRAAKDYLRTSIINKLNHIWGSETLGLKDGGYTDPKDILNEYRHTLSTSKFTVSPEGFGSDCYRTYEALLLGSVPLIDNPYTYKSLINLPVVFVTDWSLVDEEFLRKWERRLYTERYTWNFDKLTQRYWLRWVRETARTGTLRPPL